MTRIFADNIGVVSIHEKDVALPANIEVSMIGNAATGDPGLDTGIIASGFSCFITDFATSKKSQYQLKQSLDHKTHIIPFGEAPEQITIKGVTFGFDQINSAGKGSAGESSGKGIKPEYRVNTPEGTYIGFTAEEEARYKAQAQQAFKDLSGSVPEKVTPKGFVENIEYWIDKSVAVVNVVSGTVGDIKAAVTKKVGELANSDFMKGLNSILDTGLGLVNSAMSMVNDLMALPGAIVDSIMTGLGLKASKADAQMAMTRSKNSAFFPLSFPELNLLFTHMHLGSTARAAAGAKLYITYCGVRYTCALDSMSFQSDKTNNSINFSMSLIGLTKTEYYPATLNTKAVNTRGEGPSILGKILQTFGGEKVNKVINANPQIGGSIGAGVAKANITLDRLQG